MNILRTNTKKGELKMVEISVELYARLVKSEERLSVIARLLEQREYVSIEDIKAVLDIKQKAVNENAVHN